MTLLCLFLTVASSCPLVLWLTAMVCDTTIVVSLIATHHF